MKFWLDFLPLIVFFAIYHLYDIYYATAALILSMVVQLIILKIVYKHIGAMHWTAIGFVLVFGGATLFFHDANFLKMKVTIINWLFAAVLLISALIFKKNLIKALLGAQVILPPRVWTKLNGAWAVFFILLGSINLYIISFYSNDVWVDFKVFGTIGLTLLFIFLQTLYLAKHLHKNDSES